MPSRSKVCAAHQFHHHVGAAATGQLTDPAHAGFRSVEFLDVDGVVGAEFFRQFQTVLQPVQHNNAIRAALLGHGGGVDAQAAGAHNHHGLAVAHPGALQAGGDGAHGTVGPGPSRLSGSSSGTRKKGWRGGR